MILAKHVLTVYNVSNEGVPPFGGSDVWRKTIIKFGQWEDSADRNSATDGRSVISKHISIIIPKNADTQGKKYILSGDYAKLTADQKNKYWTLKLGSDYIAFGETPDITSSFTISSLQNQYKACLISAVEDLTIQPVLPHYEIVGI
ncbi:MAG: hypothetical protein FWB73_00885 [Treponema sp.]|nr:hypothetical protein [Treponema sp.]